ncbi:MAG: hypothetical protein AB7N76_30200 [Planctomycetota bacterium]
MSRRALPLLLLALAASGCQATWAEWDGDEAAEEGRFEAAVDGYRTALALDPLADVASKLGAAKAGAAKARHAAALELIQAGDLDRALASLEWAVHYDAVPELYRKALTELRARRRQLGDGLRRARQAVERQDWLRARRLLAPLQRFQATAPELAELGQRADQALVALYRQEGRRYALLGEHPRAAELLSEAAAIDAAVAGPELAQSRARAAAAAAADLAAAALAKGELGPALDRAREAAQLDPLARRSKAVLGEAQRRAVLAWLGAAERAADPRVALRDVLAAERVQPSQRALGERIVKRRETWEQTLAARYLAQGVTHERAGRWGASWLLYELAHALQPGFAPLTPRRAAVARVLQAQQTYRLVVLPFETPQGEVAPGGGALLATALRGALAARHPQAQVQVLGHEQLQGQVVAGLGLPPNAVVRGATRRLWIDTTTRGVPRALEYAAGLVPQLNGRVEQKKAAWEGIQRDLPRLQQDTAKLQRDAEQKQRAAQQADADYRRAEQQLFPFGQQMTPAERSRRQMELQRYRDRRDQANQAATFALGLSITSQALLRSQQNGAAQRLQDYLQEPPYVDVPLRRTYRFEWRELTQVVHAEAAVALHELSLGGQLGSWTSWAKVEEKDGMSAAFPPGGLQEDPLRLTAPGDFLSQGAARLAQELLPKLEGQLAHWASFALRRARGARGAGRGDDELHWLAVAWWQRGPGGLSPEDQGELRARIRDLTGWDPGGAPLDLAKLPPAPAPR